MKGNKRNLHSYVSSEWKTRENVGLQLKEAGAQATKEMEEAKVLNVFFTSSLLVTPAFRNLRPLRAVEKSGARKTYPWCMRIRLGNI